MISHTDIVIIGGGPVGAAAALALEGSGLGSIVLESRERTEGVGRERPLALAWGSRLLLERLGIWGMIDAPSLISRIRVSQRGSFGQAGMSAADAGLPALGYVVDYTRLAKAAGEKLLSCRASQVIHGAKVTDVAATASGVAVTATLRGSPLTVTASIAVIADGLPGQGARIERDYGQAALSARVRAEKEPDGTAYERFTNTGPLAVLPNGADRAIVWTLPPDEAHRMAEVAADEFLSELQRSFGFALGRFTEVFDREVHRVGLRVAGAQPCPRAIAIGNASQTLHPVAGQGFNLGLRDAWEFARAARAVGRRGMASAAFAIDYQQRRKADRHETVTATDGLVRLFSNDDPLLRAGRAAGLAAFDGLRPLKNTFARRMAIGRR